jgi:excisionase family DNA binding protein
VTAPATPAAILALPDGALLPVGWVRPLLEGLDGDTPGVGLTVAQVAERTGRAESTVRTWCAEQRLPGARRLRGREWRVPPEALQALLDGDGAPRGGAPERLTTPRGGLGAWRQARRGS